MQSVLVATLFYYTAWKTNILKRIGDGGRYVQRIYCHKLQQNINQHITNAYGYIKP